MNDSNFYVRAYSEALSSCSSRTRSAVLRHVRRSPMSLNAFRVELCKQKGGDIKYFQGVGHQGIRELRDAFHITTDEPIIPSYKSTKKPCKECGTETYNKMYCSPDCRMRAVFQSRQQQIYSISIPLPQGRRHILKYTIKRVLSIFTRH